MWKDYSSGYIKNNRSSSISIIIAAFISALLLSILCGLFYNAWKYEVERIELEEGGWQSRIVGELDIEDIESIQNFANVKNVMINDGKSTDSESVVDIYFYDYRTVFEDTPKIAELVGCLPDTVTYNYELLAMYLIRSEQDTAPRLLYTNMHILGVQRLKTVCQLALSCKSSCSASFSNFVNSS